MSECDKDGSDILVRPRAKRHVGKAAPTAPHVLEIAMRTASSSSASAAAAAARKAPAEKTVIAAPVALAERAERYQEEKKAKRSKIDEKDQKQVPPKDQAEEKQKKNKKDKSAKKDKKEKEKKDKKDKKDKKGKKAKRRGRIKLATTSLTIGARRARMKITLLAFALFRALLVEQFHDLQQSFATSAAVGFLRPRQMTAPLHHARMLSSWGFVVARRMC